MIDHWSSGTTGRSTLATDQAVLRLPTWRRIVILLAVLAVSVPLPLMTGLPGVEAAHVLLERVSVSGGGSQGDGASGLFGAVISADGRYVAYELDATNLVLSDTNSRSDVFVHDRQSHATVRVSVSTSGAEGNGNSVTPAISANGRFVAFASFATNLDLGDANGVPDIFVHDRDRDGDGIFDEAGAIATIQVSIGVFVFDSGGSVPSRVRLQGNGASYAPAISGDGRFVAFASEAFNISGFGDDTNGVRDIFVHDRDTDADGSFDEEWDRFTTRVGVGVSTVGTPIQANGGSGGIAGGVAINSSGRFVAYFSAATNLVTGDTNGVDDIFVRDRDLDGDGIFDETGVAATATVRVSTSSAGVQANGASTPFSLAISANGRFVAFPSDASNLVGDDSNGAMDVFVRDRDSDGNGIFDQTNGIATTRVSVASNFWQANNGALPNVALNGDGRYVAFAAYASNLTNLVPGDTNGEADVFVHDRQTHTTRRVSVAANGSTQANGGSFGPALSGDGRVVAFVGGATTSNLVLGDTNGRSDVFARDTAAFLPDSDGDGLLDAWEIAGFDADGDGIVDINLPALGANGTHKDLFLELDWQPGAEPTRGAIQLLKQAFAAAPPDAGGVVNPDGQVGINVWVDTGSLIDMTAGNLAGDDLGGGNSVSAPTICNLTFDGSDADTTPEFYNAKATNFNPKRRGIFRYGISAKPCAVSPSTPASPGGQGELGGDDLIVFTRGTALKESGTLMHELGHTLNLHHGGFATEDKPCKPNHVSIMNYDHAGGIIQTGGAASIIDYSPPRHAAGRGTAPLANLIENDLDETRRLDAADASNQFVFVNGAGQKTRRPLNQPVDWNGDGDTTDPSVAVDIDRDNPTGQLPEKCKAARGISDASAPIRGHNDWAVISVPMRQFGQLADGPTNLPHPGDDPDSATIDLIAAAINTADVALTMSASPNPATAGGQVVYTLTVTNRGPNPASQVQVVTTLPAGVSHDGNTAGCVVAPTATLTCDLGELLAAATRQFQITGLIDPLLVLSNGGPITITTVATVTNLAGPDPEASNNHASASVRVLGAADVAVIAFGDPNRSGAREPGEGGLPTTAFVDLNGNGVLDGDERGHATGADGTLTLRGVGLGPFRICAVTPPLRVATSPRCTGVTIASNGPPVIALSFGSNERIPGCTAGTVIDTIVAIDPVGVPERFYRTTDLKRAGTTGPWPDTRLLIQPGGTNPVVYVQPDEQVSNALLVSGVSGVAHTNLVLTFGYQPSRQGVVEVVAADGQSVTPVPIRSGSSLPNPLPTTFSAFDKGGLLYIFGVPSNGAGGYQDVYVITRVRMPGGFVTTQAGIAGKVIVASGQTRLQPIGNTCGDKAESSIFVGPTDVIGTPLPVDDVGDQPGNPNPF